MESERVHVHVDDVKISCLKSNLKGKIPIVYVHGSGCDATVWRNQLRDVGGYSIDLPNHGESGKTKIESVDDYAYYVAKFTENLLGEAIFVGHSLGGAIAQKIFTNYRDIVKGLILVSTGARLRVLPEVIEMMLKNPEASIKVVIDMAFAKKIPETDEYTKIFLKRIDILAKDLQICDKFDLLEEYRHGRIQVDVPTLIIVGEKDRLTPVKYSEFFHNHIPSSKLVIVADAGHMVMLEEPEIVSREIRDFIAEFQSY
jgi:pimeloyl-ACP methyl ester carboxylesterase